MLREAIAGVLCAGLGGLAPAQDDCSSVLRPEDVPVVRQLEAAGAYTLPAAAAGELYTLPLTIHVIRRTDGTGGLSETRIDQAVADANAMWAQADIQFCRYGPTRYVDDNNFFDLLSGAEDDIVRTIDVVADTINVYFVPNYGFCGVGGFTFAAIQGIVVANDCAGTAGNPSSFGHEIGHVLDLFHTHETEMGVECVNGSNCSTTGDLLCDTAADPRLSGLVNASCEYVGAASGPCDGDPAYDPDPRNVMSYSRKPCRDFFSPDQITRARSTLVNLRPELINFGGCGLDAPCGPGAGACLEANGTPGCEDPTCCAAVCALDPFCCNTFWDSICSNEAVDVCLTGNDCANAIPAVEGTVFGVTLIDNTAGGGSDSSCAANDGVDEWYKYDAGCNGLATASICTEFTAVDIVISVFDACNGSEIACAHDHPSCPFGGSNNAQVSWSATAGNTYYIRVSAVNATPTMNFQGSLTIDCGGCGSAAAGSCFDPANPTPYCDDMTCCNAVCAVDPSCCDTPWDAQCVDAAATLCGTCGGAGAGSCYISNGTAYCDRLDCCNTVCAVDPFCCNTSWDSICASEALSLCSIYLEGIPHFPLGDAVLMLSGPELTVANVGNSNNDGVGIVLDPLLLEGGTPAPVVSAELGILPDSFPDPSIIQLLTYTSAGAFPQTPYGGVALWAQGGVMSVLVVFQGPQTYSATILDGVEVLDEEFNLSGGLVAQALGIVAPVAIATTTHAGELSLGIRWDQQLPMTLPGGPVLNGREIVITTEFNDSPDDTATGTLELLSLTMAGVGGFTVTDETLDACPWDCGDGNGTVGINDFLAVLAEWGQIETACDFDGGGVGINEFLNVLANWGPCP